MNLQKIKYLSEDGKISRSRTSSAIGKERKGTKIMTMSTETQDFIQKICYRKTASIDMTQHGFINDSKVNPVKYVMKPLRAQLEKICVKPPAVKRYNCLPVKLPDTSTEQKPPCVPKSALSYPGSRSSRGQCRVRIQSEAEPIFEARKKKVRLVSPKKSKEKRKIRKNDAHLMSH